MHDNAFDECDDRSRPRGYSLLTPDAMRFVDGKDLGSLLSVARWLLRPVRCGRCRAALRRVCFTYFAEA